MPTIFTIFGFRFMIRTNDHEPIHVHVVKDGHSAKILVEPIEVVENEGFKKQEVAMMKTIVEENERVIIERWHEIFDK